MPDSSPIEEIKAKLDIIEVISPYLKLKKTGANYSALCPFHAEKSGSFFVSPSRQMWRCFGCGKGGDMFTFVQDIEGVEFGDALRILANKAGVELKKQTRQAQELKTERNQFYEICELAVKFFEKQLEASSMGRQAMDYLLGRGLSQDSIKTWRIGYSPDAWQGLSDFLASNGYSNSQIVGAGLAIAKAGGGVYDRFRGRIMFPIFDFNSQAVGFGGRVFKGRDNGAAAKAAGEAKLASAQGFGDVKEVKYINTPATLLYDKSRVLYGLDRAKVSIRKNNACVLVEGYTDVIMSAQAGVDNVVSTSGTALTQSQLKVLKRFTDNLVLGYDMDLAGDTANTRGIELAVAQGFNVSVARPPYEDKDPADVILENPEEWIKAVANTKTIMEFYFDRALASNDITKPQGKRKAAELLLPAIKRIGNTIEQSFWLQRLSRDIGVREEDLREELKKVKLNEYDFEAIEPKPPAKPKKTRFELLEERVVTLLLKYPGLAALAGDPADGSFSKEAARIIAELRNDKSFSGSGLEGEVKEYYNMFFMAGERESIEESSAAEEVKFYINEIKKMALKESLSRLSRSLIDAENKGNTEDARHLREEFNTVAKSAATAEAGNKCAKEGAHAEQNNTNVKTG